jgi:CubicO group peptidase (beta-lactamase class C family)
LVAPPASWGSLWAWRRRAATERGDVAKMPMSFSPGAKQAYANSGFLLLAAVVEKLRGEPYFGVLRQRVLQPLGLTRPAVSGSTLATIAPNEVRYDDWSLSLFPSVMTPDQPLVHDCYGNVNLSVGDGVGGLAFSAADYVRVLAGVALTNGNPILKPDTVKNLMWSKPSQFPHGDFTYGWGEIDLPSGTKEYCHNGGLANSHSFGCHRTDGLSFAVVFNKGAPAVEQMPMWDDLLDAVDAWPTNDLFPALGIPAFP